LAEKKYDLIIINSVIQYFPGIDYLESVIKKASGLLTDGGKLFIGDVRNYGLLDLFAMTVELEKSGDKISASEFLTSVQNRIDEEEELTIDPAYFSGLKNIFPDLTDVGILLKKGNYVNALTKYRYDVVLTVNGMIDENDEVVPVDYTENNLTVSDIKSVISSDNKKTHAFSNIPDGRIFNEIKLRELINRTKNNHNLR